MWYVGLDWADTHHDVEVLDEAGKRVGVRRFVHSHDGLNELKQFLLGIATQPENLACIVEINHGLLITFLLEAGIPVYPVNPKTANQLRKAAGAKTDHIDALTLAHHLYSQLELGVQVANTVQLIRRLVPPTEAAAQLKGLIGHRYELIGESTQRKNKLTALCDEILSKVLPGQEPPAPLLYDPHVHPKHRQGQYRPLKSTPLPNTITVLHPRSPE